MKHTLRFLLRQIFHTPTLLLLAVLVFVPLSTHAQFYYEDDYYYAFEDGYSAYESNVQDAFATSNPSPSAPQGIQGRRDIWGGYDEELHPGDPLPVGEHTVLFIFAAITAMIIFIQQRKRKGASSTSHQRLLTLALGIITASAVWAQTEGDYRLQYVEQTVASYTNINVDYSISSDIIKPSATPTSNTVSLHIYNKVKQDGTKVFNGINNPEIILQQYTGGTWVDKECYMVFGPLQINTGGVIKLPGRKNASDDSDIDDFVYDQGIQTILNDPTDNGCGVWNFIVVQDGTSATIDIDRTHRYTGNYYIRTILRPLAEIVEKAKNNKQIAIKMLPKLPVGTQTLIRSPILIRPALSRSQ